MTHNVPQPPQNPAAQPPPVVIHNNVSAVASAGAHVHGRPYRRRQSAKVHLVLLFTTGGLGNLAYAWYISSWNRRAGW